MARTMKGAVFAGALLGLTFGGALSKLNWKNDSFAEIDNAPHKRICVERTVSEYTRTLQGPSYSQSEVPSNMCSRYVRMAAHDMFGIEYPRADAWDIRDDPKIDEIKVRSKLDLKSLVESNFLKPGMILGLYYPESKYNKTAEEDGAGYTHVALYLGEEDGNSYFADKFGKRTRTKISIDDLLNNGNLEPREVLFANK